jgi:hypothetical protein
VLGLGYNNKKGRRKMSEFDQELTERYRLMLGEILALRARLLQTDQRTGCACDAAGLCSIHSQAYNRLTTIADELARAIGDLQND